jgi:hypothetical protein
LRTGGFQDVQQDLKQDLQQDQQHGEGLMKPALKQMLVVSSIALIAVGGTGCKRADNSSTDTSSASGASGTAAAGGMNSGMGAAPASAASGIAPASGASQ